MADKEHCYRHGCDYPYGRTCPECAREEDLEDRQSLQDAIENIRDELSSSRIDADDLGDRLNNPGSYYCPECRFRTLNYLATRCFKCQSNISNDFWEDIKRREKEEREKREKAAAEAKAKAERDAAEAQKKAEREREKQSAQNSCAFTVIVLCGVLLFIIMWATGTFDPAKHPSVTRTPLAEDNTPPPQPSTNAAQEVIPPGPERIIDRGCPLGDCGARWLAIADVDLYEEPPKDPENFDVSSLRTKLKIHMGEWAIVETGIVVAKKRQGGTRRGAEVEDGTLIEPYQRIACYTYLGGDRYKCWTNGRLAVVSGVGVSDTQINEDKWWIRLRASDRTQAWTNCPQSFVNQNQLDKELADTISNAELAFAEKLAKIESLVERGADLSRTEKYFGTTPFRAALETRDLELLERLFAKGLSLQKGGCPASEVAWVVNGPKGDSMLELL